MGCDPPSSEGDGSPKGGLAGPPIVVRRGIERGDAEDVGGRMGRHLADHALQLFGGQTSGLGSDGWG